jgi:PAS domain S-box-containing protein
LRISDERFRAYLQNSTEGIWCVEFEHPLSIDLSEDEQLDIIYKYAYFPEANDAYARMVGFMSREELIGKQLDEIMPPSVPQNIDTLKKIIRARYNTTDTETIEFTPKGETRIFLNNLVGIIEAGIVLRVWGTHHDITKRKAAEDKLRKAEQKYRTVADFTYDWEYWRAPNGRMLYVSPSCCEHRGLHS